MITYTDKDVAYDDMVLISDHACRVTGALFIAVIYCVKERLPLLERGVEYKTEEFLGSDFMEKHGEEIGVSIDIALLLVVYEKDFPITIADTNFPRFVLS